MFNGYIVGFTYVYVALEQIELNQKYIGLRKKTLMQQVKVVIF